MMHNNFVKYNALSRQGQAQFLLAVLFGGVNVLSALMNGNLMVAAIVVVVSVVTYMIGAWVIEKLLSKGMSNVAWVVAFHPVVEQCALRYGYSVRGELADALAKLTGVKAFSRASDVMEKPVLKTVKNKLGM